MAERVMLWKSNNGKYFETLKEAEKEDRAKDMEDVFLSVPDDLVAEPLVVIARYLAEQGYRITNINPEHASA